MKADWYDTPLYYDIIFDTDTEKEATFLEQVMQLHGGMTVGTPLRILEPACGSGRLISALTQRGHQVAGFDLNENMLAYTRARLGAEAASISLWQDRMESFEPPGDGSYNLAHCLVSTFKYVLDEEGSESHLKRVSKALRTGGLYVLGLHLTDYDDRGMQHERWVAERDGIRVVCNTRTWPADRATRTEKLRTRLRITRGGSSWTQETHWAFRTYSLVQLRALLRKVPSLELVTCHDFNYDTSHPMRLSEATFDVVLVLRKR